jgi:hypothetical protein
MNAQRILTNTECMTNCRHRQQYVLQKTPPQDAQSSGSADQRASTWVSYIDDDEDDDEEEEVIIIMTS